MSHLPIPAMAPLQGQLLTSDVDTVGTENAAIASRVSHGSAAGSQPGTPEGSNSSVAKPSQASVDTFGTLAEHPSAKRTRPAEAEIITQQPMEDEDESFNLSLDDSPIKETETVRVPALNGLPPTMPSDIY